VDANGVIKISDFGLSKKLTDVTGATNAGTPPYMAPEVNNRAYGHPADVYSFGLMLWELWYRKRIFTCIAPLGGLTAVEEFILFMRRGERPEFPADDQPPWVDLIKSCWKHSPVDRPVFTQVVQELEKLSKEA
jgi:serine/threonine protein kinase